jgi:ribosomal protein S6
MFIYNLSVVFTTNLSNMAPTRVKKRLQEQDFTGRNLRQRGSKQLRKKMRKVWSAD